ncbi:N-acetylmuramoyl-L-alanine amidase [Nitrosomonas sp. Nm84]|uniref:N-acetylmuramoyl-L-alanine amidase n=1 Tax=Nitrosomonas sp. Nm84 TaxID=200124 RepID=UPI000D765756|nr:N-acetylmuramoyl-L-alanine amidase [Nitrosomonas sp. Nm84]PXW89866.1 N-acetylmuramoyl-L-alanine amidase [Nitrosomonas sp. Nm84]
MLRTLEKSEQRVITYFSKHNIACAKGIFLAFLILTCLLLLLNQPALAADVTVKSVRVGLTPDYTRITLESNQPLQYELSMLDNPHRVIVDLSNIKPSPALATLPQKVNAIDPLVEKVRIGQFKPDVIRLVFDLKANVVPRTFVVAPKENYAHRLILDIYHPDKAAKTDSNANFEAGLGADSTADMLDELVATLIQGGKRPKASHTQPSRPLPKPQQASQSKQPTAGSQAAKNRKPMMVPRIIIVAIDPGHGGKDPGAVGYQGTHEKDVTLAIARKLKERIDKEPNMRAILTRTGDYYISLPQRRINARRANADLFVSIHADANPKSHAHGSSVFTLSEHGATSTTASWLADKENSVDNDLMGGIDITSKSKDIKELLLDLSLNATINDSVKLAEHVLKQLGDINHLHKKGVEQAGFAVLKSPDIPSILVETAFLSNPKEEEKLRNNTYQNKMADAVFVGIRNYFASNPALTRAEMAQVK